MVSKPRARPPIVAPRDDHVIKEAIKQTLLALGLDPDDPLMSQEFFAALREVARLHKDPDAIADRAWIRERRTEAEKLVNAGKVARIGATFTFIGGLLLWAIKTIFDVVAATIAAAMPHGGPPPGS